MKLNSNWSFYSEEFRDGQKFTSNIPTSVQYALYQQGILPDYNIGLNERDYFELENYKWVFTKEFDVTNCGYETERLRFLGVDTVAEIYLNDILIGKTDNMFVEFDFDVRGILRKGKNIIEVKFCKLLDYLNNIIVGQSEFPLYSSMDKRRPYIRKMQCSWGWDWGVRILETGLWKDVVLEQYNGVRISQLHAELINEKSIIIEGEISGSEENSKIECIVTYEGRTVSEATFYATNRMFKQIIEMDEIKLWYPLGYGKQNLYSISCTVESNNETDQKIIETGFKTVNLIRQNDGEGESFVFEINGIKIFAKGACVVPFDAFICRVAEEDYKYYIEKAVESNINMLRIWGGGIYESDIFYRECNRAGIMVWQDFMFSCAEYPDHLPDFLETCKIEIEQNLKRLRINPCIVLYCGNNENNWIMQLNTDKSDDYKYSGNILYKVIMPDLCNKYAEKVPFWISSPYSLTGDCNSDASGDKHNWEVHCFNKDIDTYEQCKGKFISEFGMHGSAHLKTINEYTPENEWSITSDTTFNHNKSTGSIERNVAYLLTEVGGYNDFNSYNILSQFIQGEALKKGVEHWRSRKFKTAGTLYWQYNDNWCATSYSAIDYKKREKGLYYYTKRFYDDILVAMKSVDDVLKITIVNDKLTDISGNLKISAYHLDGELLSEKEISVTIPRNSSSEICSERISGFVKTMGNTLYPNYSNKFPNYFDLGTVNVGEIDASLRNIVFFTELMIDGEKYENHKMMLKHRRMNIKEPKINYTISGNVITLISDKPAFCVYIETDNDTHLSDNFLTLKPNSEYKVFSDKLLSDLKVYNLYNLKDKSI